MLPLAAAGLLSLAATGLSARLFLGLPAGLVLLLAGLEARLLDGRLVVLARLPAPFRLSLREPGALLASLGLSLLSLSAGLSVSGRLPLRQSASLLLVAALTGRVPPGGLLSAAGPLSPALGLVAPLGLSGRRLPALLVASPGLAALGRLPEVAPLLAAALPPALLVLPGLCGLALPGARLLAWLDLPA